MDKTRRRILFLTHREHVAATCELRSCVVVAYGDVIVMDVREHREKLVTATDVQKLIDVLPWLDRFRALERMHEDRTTPTMGIVISTIVDYVSLIRDAERTLPAEIRHLCGGAEQRGVALLST